MTRPVDEDGTTAEDLGITISSDTGTPLLRADATDDDLQDDELNVLDRKLEERLEQRLDEPKPQVPVVIDGVFHGMRDAD